MCVMCCRYYIREDDLTDDLHAAIAAVNRTDIKVKACGEVFPSDYVPVFANNRALRPSAFVMQWGYTFQGGKLLINARSETAAEKPSFADGIKNRRCLIPASWYYEWEQKASGKTKYAIGIDSSFMLLAGIYRFENSHPVFTILTQPPADEISFIHPRMPVLLPHDAKEDYLNLNYKASDVIRSASYSLRFEVAQ